MFERKATYRDFQRLLKRLFGENNTECMNVVVYSGGKLADFAEDIDKQRNMIRELQNKIFAPKKVVKKKKR